MAEALLPLLQIGEAFYYKKGKEKEILVWDERKLPILVKDDDLLEKAVALRDRGNDFIITDALVKLVEDSGGSGEWASFVASLSNLKRPAVVNTEFPEMMYQQQVFCPISSLFFAFNPFKYAADSQVHAGNYYIQDERGNPLYTNATKPDAAIKASSKHLVLATMELKTSDLVNNADIVKCVKITSISAIAMVRGNVADKIEIPFVVNIREQALLFRTRVEKSNECPVIELLSDGFMSIQKERSLCVSYLAVLISKLKKELAKDAGKEFVRNLNFINPVSSSSAKPSSSKRSYSASGSSISVPFGKTPRTNSDSTGKQAMTIALCQGEVVNLSFSEWTKNDSPFYYVGVLKTSLTPVFVKVWCEGDDRTNRGTIEMEMSLLQFAGDHGVPCPAVIHHLSALDITNNEGRFHRLVMHKMANDNVDCQDLQVYALSTLAAVQSLHEAGILHCDLKPNNIVWNSSTKTAFLVDFGHAQKEECAKPYTGTVGYTAPEVQRKEVPHSRLTEAYSVGRTLLDMCGQWSNGASNTLTRRVQMVADRLSREDPNIRITLEEARGELTLPSSTTLPSHYFGVSHAPKVRLQV